MIFQIIVRAFYDIHCTLTGVEIVSCSVLPTGSGMGGSSVLAAVIIDAINARMGDSMSREMLMYTVSTFAMVFPYNTSDIIATVHADRSPKSSRF